MSIGASPNSDGALRLRLDRLQSRALVVGGAGLVLSLGAGLIWPAEFLRAYLVGYVFWVGIALGCLGLTMLHHLTGRSVIPAHGIGRDDAPAPGPVVLADCTGPAPLV
jgi:hypothetical protein